MFYLKNTTKATNAAITVKTDTSTELDFENHLSLPFSDRRIGDRRIPDRRIGDRRNIKKITILLPCYNEEKGLGKVFDGVPLKKLTHLVTRPKLLSSITTQATIPLKLL